MANRFFFFHKLSTTRFHLTNTKLHHITTRMTHTIKGKEVTTHHLLESKGQSQHPSTNKRDENVGHDFHGARDARSRPADAHGEQGKVVNR